MGELWGIMEQLWLMYGELWLNYGELWGSIGNYGVLWGIMGIYVRVSADASVFLIPFVVIPADMSSLDFHAFNNVLYVRLPYLYKPPREYLSQGHLARVMKKQDIKCVSSTEIGLAGAWGRRGGGWVSCTDKQHSLKDAHHLGRLSFVMNGVVPPPVAI